MAKQSYDESLRRLLLHEGGYTNHPADPGGPTNFGITIYDYRKYVNPNATAADVKVMSIDEAKRIYRAKYWDAQRCDELPAGVDYAVFDYGVNSGIGRAEESVAACAGRCCRWRLRRRDHEGGCELRSDGHRYRDLRRTVALSQTAADLACVRQRLGAAGRGGKGVFAGACRQAAGRRTSAVIRRSAERQRRRAGGQSAHNKAR